MLSKIIRLPEDFAKGDETKKFMQAIVTRDYALFESRFLRKHLGIDAEEGE